MQDGVCDLIITGHEFKCTSIQGFKMGSLALVVSSKRLFYVVETFSVNLPFFPPSTIAWRRIRIGPEGTLN